MMPGSLSMHHSKVVELSFQVVLHCALRNNLGLLLDWIYVDQLGCLVTKFWSFGRKHKIEFALLFHIMNHNDDKTFPNLALPGLVFRVSLCLQPTLLSPLPQDLPRWLCGRVYYTYILIYEGSLITTRCYSDMEFVKKFTPHDFQAKNFTPSMSPNFNSFSDKNTKKWVKMEEFTPPALTALTNSNSDQQF